MPSEAIDRCLEELTEANDALMARLQALQTYMIHGVSEDTATWLTEQMSLARDRLSLMESTKLWLSSLRSSGYPEMTFGAMPASARADLDQVSQRLEHESLQMTEIMRLIIPAGTAVDHEDEQIIMHDIASDEETSEPETAHTDEPPEDRQTDDRPRDEDEPSAQTSGDREARSQEPHEADDDVPQEHRDIDDHDHSKA